jgi:hypothetical protein
MKTLREMEISDELSAEIGRVSIISGLRRVDVVRQALQIGLSQFAAQSNPPPLWLEERILEALAEPAEPVSLAQFKKEMKAIANGR